jgi:hypothetical protein
MAGGERQNLVRKRPGGGQFSVGERRKRGGDGALNI